MKQILNFIKRINYYEIYKINKIIQPDDWHVHLREGEMMKAVINILLELIIDV